MVRFAALLSSPCIHFVSFCGDVIETIADLFDGRLLQALLSLLMNEPSTFSTIGIPSTGMKQLDSEWSFIMSHVNDAVSPKLADIKTNTSGASTSPIPTTSSMTTLSSTFLPFFSVTSTASCIAYGRHLPTEAPLRAPLSVTSLLSHYSTNVQH
jgi:hypothetical protein